MLDSVLLNLIQLILIVAKKNCDKTILITPFEYLAFGIWLLYWQKKTHLLMLNFTITTHMDKAFRGVPNDVLQSALDHSRGKTVVNIYCRHLIHMTVFLRRHRYISQNFLDVTTQLCSKTVGISCNTGFVQIYEETSPTRFEINLCSIVLPRAGNLCGY